MAESRFDLILRELRRERKLTQKDVADAIGVTASTLSGYEVGTKTPTLPVAMKLAGFFNVSLDYLCGKTSDRSESNLLKINMDTPVTKYLSDIVTMCEVFEITVTNDENAFNLNSAVLTFNNGVFTEFILNYVKLRDLRKSDALSEELYQLSLKGLIDKYKDVSVSDAVKKDYDGGLPF